MATKKSNSIKAIELTRQVFESIYGNLGLLKFNVESLVPTNGTNDQDSQKWAIKCSLYRTLGDIEPTRFEVSVDLNENLITFNETEAKESTVKKYKVVEEE